MCGIFGYIGDKNASQILVQGLLRLEYRGYDSSGLIVLSSKNSFHRARSVGKVSNLEKNLRSRNKEINGKIGKSKQIRV